MKCPMCGTRKKTRLIAKYYTFAGPAIKTYECHCNKCDSHWLPHKQEMKLDKKIKQYTGIVITQMARETAALFFKETEVEL